MGASSATCRFPYHERVGKSKVHLLRDGLRSLQIIVTIIAQFNSMKLFLPLIIVTVLGTSPLGRALRQSPPFHSHMADPHGGLAGHRHDYCA